MAAYGRAFGFDHLRADYPGLESALERNAHISGMGLYFYIYLYVFTIINGTLFYTVGIQLDCICRLIL